GAAERILLLKEHYDNENWDDYGIYVHALKSTSAMIGANNLSAIAAGLEKAAGDKDVTVINRDHEKAMEMYDSLVAVIKGFVQADDDKDGKADASESGYEVLEFMPADENDDATH
ncbi:MAG: Hpt domain-containing protein, partial [Lachnospiraceae bacterium]|nr:Hpt domain-containing protein [Lachnospiraceae bacterium]